jgi:hypothetical protein
VLGPELHIQEAKVLAKAVVNPDVNKRSLSPENLASYFTVASSRPRRSELRPD